VGKLQYDCIGTTYLFNVKWCDKGEDENPVYTYKPSSVVVILVIISKPREETKSLLPR
jgi:hypothetical protein